MNKWDLFSPEEKVIYTIYEHNKKNEDIWFSKLVTKLKGKPSKATISKSIDKLYDMGMIDGDWKQVNHRWVRAFRVAGEASDYAKKLYDRAKK